MADLPFTLDQLRILRAIASEGSFKKAADSLYVTQPAVSRMLSRFEGHLGLRLFERGGKGAVLTPEGEILYRRVADGFRSIETGLREVELGLERNLLVIPVVVESFEEPRELRARAFANRRLLHDLAQEIGGGVRGPRGPRGARCGVGRAGGVGRGGHGSEPTRQAWGQRPAAGAVRVSRTVELRRGRRRRCAARG